MKSWQQSLYVCVLTMIGMAACSVEERDSRCPALIGGGRYCLQPSTAVTPFDARQKVEIRFRGRQETMIIEVEADAAGIRLVGLTPFGQTLLRLNDDNVKTTATLPHNSRLPAELMVALLQVALWPGDVLREGLVSPMRLEEVYGQRRIVNRDKVAVTINYTGDQLPYRRIQMYIHSEDVEIDVETL
jgi:hypothetical protein